VKTEFKLSGVDGVLEMLRKLPPELVSRGGGPVRTAGRRGMSIIHKQALANLQAVTSNETSEEERLSTGFLAKNVVITRGKPPTDGKGERILIRVRRKGYPARSAGTGKKTSGVTTLKTAQLLEYGSSQQDAEPWLRPAFESRVREAISSIERELGKAIERIAKRLAKGKGA
jgi:hypothetical protein